MFVFLFNSLELIFKPFSQGTYNIHRDYGGTGLGLVISKKLVELMGGRINVSSKFGKGSTFAVELPLMRSQNPKLPEAKKSEATARFSNLRVLLVEDNPSNAFLGMEILMKMGCQAKTAENAAQGLILWGKEEFDLLLIDIQMPEMNGIEMLKVIRSKEADLNKKHQPAIALTAHALEGNKEMYRTVGFDGYVSKPMDMEILAKEINEALKTLRI